MAPRRASGPHYHSLAIGCQPLTSASIKRGQAGTFASAPRVDAAERTFGLLAVIWGCARLRSAAVPFAVGAYITGAYWFTSSTSFANPAVTLAMLVTGKIQLVKGFLYVVVQCVAAIVAIAVLKVRHSIVNCTRTRT